MGPKYVVCAANNSVLLLYEVFSFYICINTFYAPFWLINYVLLYK
jgi:hypothetical protein